MAKRVRMSEDDIFPDTVIKQGTLKRALLIDLGTSATCIALSDFADSTSVKFNFLTPKEKAENAAVNDQNCPAIASSKFEKNDGQFLPDLLKNYRYSGEGPTPYGYRVVSSLKRGLEASARTLAPGTSWERDGVLDVAAFVIMLLDHAVVKDLRPILELIHPPSIIYASVPNSFPPAAVRIFQAGIAAAVTAAFKLDKVPEVVVVPEGVAVAYRAESLLREQAPAPPQGSDDVVLLVVDAGAGTTDASIVRVADNGDRGKRVTVEGSAGLPVGGLDIDILLWVATGKKEDRESQTPDRLRFARETKEKAWDNRSAQIKQRMDNANIEEALTIQLSAIDRGVDRFLALTVDGLLSNLPSFPQVTHYIISGRASQFKGFEDLVTEHELLKNKPRRIEAMGDKRKQLVIEGLASYARQQLGTSRIQNVRSSFEIYLSRGNIEDPIVPINTNLGEGYSAIAWTEKRLDVAEWPYLDLRLRLIKKTSIDKLENLDCFQPVALRPWCDFLLLRARRTVGENRYLLEFDHFGLAVALNHNANESPGEMIVNDFRNHPVHELSEREIATL